MTRARKTFVCLDTTPYYQIYGCLLLLRNIYFRTLFQQLLDQLRNSKSQITANQLGGYDFSQFGTLIWAPT